MVELDPDKRVQLDEFVAENLISSTISCIEENIRDLQNPNLREDLEPEAVAASEAYTQGRREFERKKQEIQDEFRRLEEVRDRTSQKWKDYKARHAINISPRSAGSPSRQKRLSARDTSSGFNKSRHRRS